MSSFEREPAGRPPTTSKNRWRGASPVRSGRTTTSTSPSRSSTSSSSSIRLPARRPRTVTPSCMLTSVPGYANAGNVCDKMARAPREKLVLTLNRPGGPAPSLVRRKFTGFLRRSVRCLARSVQKLAAPVFLLAASQDIRDSAVRKCNTLEFAELSLACPSTLPRLRQRHRRSTHARCRTVPSTEHMITAFATSSARSVIRPCSPSLGSPAPPPPAGSAGVRDRWSRRSCSPRTSSSCAPGS